MNVLAIVPARGGSKGLPGKNLRKLAGRPLLEWSIVAATQSARVSTVAVSSDSDEILAVAAACGGAELIKRPADLATDTASTDAVMVPAVDVMTERDGARPDLVVLLQPTVPVRSPGLVDACIDRLEATGADSLLTGYPLHFVWWKESEGYGYDEGRAGGTGRPSVPAWRSQCPRRPRRQDLTAREVMFAEDGSVYVTRADVLMATGRRLAGRVELFKTERTPDIDGPEDFVQADALLLYRQIMAAPVSWQRQLEAAGGLPDPV